MYIKNFLIFILFSVFTISLPNAVFSQVDRPKEFKIGLAGGENEADRLKNYECWRAYLERKLEIPVKFYPASDVAGIIHGLLGKTLDYASVGPSAYAAMYEERTGIAINQIVIAIAVENLEVQVFIKKPSEYIQEFIDLRKSYDIIHPDD